MEFDEKALNDLYNNGDAWFTIAKYNDKDFMIIDGWDDVEKIQKALVPSFEPKDKYDTSVLDEYMDWGFSDSYTTCEECGNVICTEPDSKHWVPDFWVGDGFILCGDCVRNNPREYLEYLTNNPEVANTILRDGDLSGEGYIALDDEYENGWYGKVDDPHDILDRLLEEHPNGQFIFSITNQQQFGTWFKVWALEESLEENLEEGLGNYLYLFPEGIDKEEFEVGEKSYGLKVLGHFDDDGFMDTVVQGSKQKLIDFAHDILDYELHPDYLYKVNEFAGEIID